MNNRIYIAKNINFITEDTEESNKRSIAHEPIYMSELIEIWGYTFSIFDWSISKQYFVVHQSNCSKCIC